MEFKNQSFKNLMSSLQLDVEITAYTHCWKDWEDLNYVPSYNKFYFICDGAGWLRINGKDYYPIPGQLFLMPAGIVQSYGTINDTPFTKYWCHFSAKIGEMNLFDIIDLPNYIDAKDISRVEQLFKDLIFYHANNDFPSAFRVKAVLLEILAHFIENAKIDKINFNYSNSSKKLGSVMDYIENHLSENITVEKLASISHFHPSYFIRFFKTNTGLSPIRYINRIRLEKAKKLLSYSKLNVSEISIETGFNDVFHFSKSFKNYTGFSPSEYRKIEISTILK
jgi:AraC family transcriptional regulator, arabinose operon regulatory protein